MLDKAPQRDAGNRHHTAEYHHYEEQFGGIKRKHQLAQVQQNSEAFTADLPPHGPKNAKRSEIHDVARVLEHHFGKRFAELHDRLGFAPESCASGAEKEGE